MPIMNLSPGQLVLTLFAPVIVVFLIWLVCSLIGGVGYALFSRDPWRTKATASTDYVKEFSQFWAGVVVWWPVILIALFAMLIFGFIGHVMWRLMLWGCLIYGIFYCVWWILRKCWTFISE